MVDVVASSVLELWLGARVGDTLVAEELRVDGIVAIDGEPDRPAVARPL